MYVIGAIFKGRQKLLSENQRHGEWSNRHISWIYDILRHLHGTHEAPPLMEVHQHSISMGYCQNVHNRIIFSFPVDCFFLSVQLTAWLFDLQFRFWYTTNTSSLSHSHITLSWRYKNPQNMPNYSHETKESHPISTNIVSKVCNDTFIVTREMR